MHFYFVNLHIVEHAVCEGKIVGLVHYPTTVVPVNMSVSVIARCADNTHRTSSSLNVSCTSSGSSWSGTTPQCQCDTLYHAIAVGGRQICKGGTLVVL